MFRAFLVLVTVAIAIALWDQGIFDATQDHRNVASSEDPGSARNVMARPSIRVLDPPAELSLNQDSSVDVQADAPASPGDRIVLRTAGAYNIGYAKVSTAYLDQDLKATLTVPGRRYLGSYRYWATIPASGTYQEGTSATFSIAVVAATPPPAPDCGKGDQVKADGTPWTCTFDDEFIGSTLDRHYWVPQDTAYSGFTTGTKSRYACAADSADTVAVRNGNLELSLIKLPGVQRCSSRKSSAYAFGQVMHYQTFSQTYGKYEVRAKVPDLDVPGSQQSFWLWPQKNTYGGWPASGEIDFAELYSSTPGIDKPYLHYLPGETTGGTNTNVTHGACQINVGEFNTYGVEWKPRQITVLLNGEVCFTDDYSSIAASFQGASSPFDKPFYLSLNQAMGAIGNEYDPALMPDRISTQIDYVRIWK